MNYKFISHESILEAKKRIGDNPFVFKDDFLKIIKDESPDLLLWAGNYSKAKFEDDKDSTGWFSFGVTFIFALFDFEIQSRNLDYRKVTEEVIEKSWRSFKEWADLKKYYEDFKINEPHLFEYLGKILQRVKDVQKDGREKVKYEDVVVIAVCYVYKMYEIIYSKPPQTLLDEGLFLFDNDPKFRELDVPAIEIPIEKLVWQLNMPVWEKEGTDYWNLTPMEALNVAGSEHFKRIMNAELSFPIIVTEYKDRLVILDGMHRLARANIQSALSDYKENNTIKAKFIPKELLKQRYEI